MTAEEFKSLKSHSRIKYTGAKTLEQLFNRDDIPKVWKTKGVIVNSAMSYTDNGGWSYSGKNKGTGKTTYTLSLYGAYLQNVNPEEWVLVDARAHVEKDMDYKHRRAYIKRTCSNFKNKFRSLITSYKDRMDDELGHLPLDKKLKLLMEIDNEYKKWFGIINMDPDTALAAIEKTYLGDEYEAPADGSSTSQKDQ